MFFRLLTIVFAAVAISTTAQAEERKDDKPNIVLLLADDAGARDFGFMGSREIRTPNIDRIARHGVTFTQAYAPHQVCGPSRAAILTGKYPQRFGYEYNTVANLVSPNGKYGFEDQGLPLSQVTLADRLRDLGYRTALFGKWHLGVADRYHPLQRGFDEFYGFRGGARSFFAYSASNPLDADENRMERGLREFEEFDGYLTDVLAQEGVSFMQRNKDQPFFVMLSFNAVHTPMEALPEDLAQYPDLSGLRQKQAAMLHSLDRAAGKVLDALDQLGLAENTIVVFTNDNGGATSVNAAVNFPFAGEKATHLEGGLRVPFAMRWPDKLALNSVYEEPVSLIDLLPSFVSAAGGDPFATGPLDGVSLWPYLSGAEAGYPHEALYWKRDVRATMRQGDWKLLRMPDRPAELYNLATDPGEQTDLAAQEPERLRAMFKRLADWEYALERPLWMREPEVERRDMQIHERYRVPQEHYEPYE